MNLNSWRLHSAGKSAGQHSVRNAVSQFRFDGARMITDASDASSRFKSITRILVANRSEIAIRVFRAAAELGIGTIAIYAEEDKLSLHRFKADEAYQVGKGRGPLEAYLSVE